MGHYHHTAPPPLPSHIRFINELPRTATPPGVGATTFRSKHLIFAQLPKLRYGCGASHFYHMSVLFSYVGWSTSSHAMNNFYPKVNTTAPINKPMIPDKSIPPMAPMKITTIGTSNPRPKNIGLRILSRSLTKIDHIRNRTDVRVSCVENT